RLSALLLGNLKIENRRPGHSARAAIAILLGDGVRVLIRTIACEPRPAIVAHTREIDACLRSKAKPASRWRIITALRAWSMLDRARGLRVLSPSASAASQSATVSGAAGRACS